MGPTYNSVLSIWSGAISAANSLPLTCVHPPSFGAEPEDFRYGSQLMRCADSTYIQLGLPGAGMSTRVSVVALHQILCAVSIGPVQQSRMIAV